MWRSGTGDSFGVSTLTVDSQGLCWGPGHEPEPVKTILQW